MEAKSESRKLASLHIISSILRDATAFGLQANTGPLKFSPVPREEGVLEAPVHPQASLLWENRFILRDLQVVFVAEPSSS